MERSFLPGHRIGCRHLFHLLPTVIADRSVRNASRDFSGPRRNPSSIPSRVVEFFPIDNRHRRESFRECRVRLPAHILHRQVRCPRLPGLGHEDIRIPLHVLLAQGGLWIVLELPPGPAFRMDSKSNCSSSMRMRRPRMKLMSLSISLSMISCSKPDPRVRPVDTLDADPVDLERTMRP